SPWHSAARSRASAWLAWQTVIRIVSRYSTGHTTGVGASDATTTYGTGVSGVRVRGTLVPTCASAAYASPRPSSRSCRAATSPETWSPITVVMCAAPGPPGPPPARPAPAHRAWPDPQQGYPPRRPAGRWGTPARRRRGPLFGPPDLRTG